MRPMTIVLAVAACGGHYHGSAIGPDRGLGCYVVQVEPQDTAVEAFPDTIALISSRSENRPDFYGTRVTLSQGGRHPSLALLWRPLRRDSLHILGRSDSLRLDFRGRFNDHGFEGTVESLAGIIGAERRSRSQVHALRADCLGF